MGLKSRSRAAGKTRETQGAAASKEAVPKGAKPGALSPEALLDRMHWMRQGLGVVTGMVLGALQITGSVGVIIFLAVAVLMPNAYFARVLPDVDETEVAKAGSLKTEGVISAFALFLLMWILVYTTFL